MEISPHVSLLLLLLQLVVWMPHYALGGASAHILPAGNNKMVNGVLQQSSSLRWLAEVQQPTEPFWEAGQDDEKEGEAARPQEDEEDNDGQPGWDSEGRQGDDGSRDGGGWGDGEGGEGEAASPQEDEEDNDGRPEWDSDGRQGGDDGSRDGGRGWGDASSSTSRDRDDSSDDDREPANAQGWYAWTPRIPALLSMMGSGCILWSIWGLSAAAPASSRGRPRGSRKINMYQQLVSAVSFFDLIGSLAWLLSTLPMPSGDGGRWGDMYGAHGTDTTCKLQGLAFQWSFSGTFYFTSLAIYYLVTIRYGKKESTWEQPRRNWRWHVLMIIPLLAGTVLALIAWPYYSFTLNLCHIPPKSSPIWNRMSKEPSHIVHYVTTLPVTLAFGVALISMMLTYLHVRKTDRAADKWRMSTVELSRASTTNESSVQGYSASQSMSVTGERPRERRSTTTASRQMSNAVFWQFVLYTVAFFLTWTFFFISKIRPGSDFSFAFRFVLLVLTPLQGFWNAIIYFRRTLAAKWDAHWRKRDEKQRAAHLRRSETIESMSERRPADLQDNNDNDNKNKPDGRVCDRNINTMDVEQPLPDPNTLCENPCNDDVHIDGGDGAAAEEVSKEGLENAKENVRFVQSTQLYDCSKTIPAS